MSAKKNTAAGGNPTAAKKNTTTKIIAVPLDVVNMSDAEIIDAAIGRLMEQDKKAKYDRYGAIMHAAVRDALCEFCRQNAEFAGAICQTDKPFYTVEVSRGLKVMQCYGYKNNKAGNDKPPEIEAFEKDYQHYLEELKREQERNKQKLQQSA